MRALLLAAAAAAALWHPPPAAAQPLDTALEVSPAGQQVSIPFNSSSGAAGLPNLNLTQPPVVSWGSLTAVRPKAS